ncbi:MAG TPA: UBP-type zinc finger domain-containing protein [Anaeromyxobacteraceae bacterium]|nr:UBP-type zinc finger domain-containing protein [Anaeromyxobacteraceae bacterium]
MCKHLASLSRPRPAPVTPSSFGCQECLEQGEGWVHLRLCMSCGHVGCCDSSPHKHATRHFHATRHPVMKSFEPGEDWAWCYLDEEMVASFPTFPEESASRHFEQPSP